MEGLRGFHRLVMALMETVRAWLPWDSVRGVPVRRPRGRFHGGVRVMFLGLFKLAGDEDDADVIQNEADLREEDVYKPGRIGDVMF